MKASVTSLSREWSLYYYRSLFTRKRFLASIHPTRGLHAPSIALPRNRTATRVSNLPTHSVSLATRVRARASERDASSALNEFSRRRASPRAGLVRRVCACTCACVCVFDCKRVARQMNIPADGGLLTPNATIIFRYFVIARIIFYRRNLYPIISCGFSTFIRASTYQRSKRRKYLNLATEKIKHARKWFSLD